MGGRRETDVHDWDTSLVQPLDGLLGGNTNGADEKSGLLLDDNVDEGVKGTLGVVVLIDASHVISMRVSEPAV